MLDCMFAYVQNWLLVNVKEAKVAEIVPVRLMTSLNLSLI